MKQIYYWWCFRTTNFFQFSIHIPLKAPPTLTTSFLVIFFIFKFRHQLLELHNLSISHLLIFHYFVQWRMANHTTYIMLTSGRKFKSEENQKEKDSTKIILSFFLVCVVVIGISIHGCLYGLHSQIHRCYLTLCLKNRRIPQHPQLTTYLVVNV